MAQSAPSIFVRMLNFLPVWRVILAYQRILRQTVKATVRGIDARPRKVMRDAAIFRNGFKVIWVVQILPQKYFRFHRTQITGLISAIPFRMRGRWPSSRTLGRVAVDARRRRALFARGRTTPI